ncbi:MAG: ABC transporter permease [Alkaliphilus sp.]
MVIKIIRAFLSNLNANKSSVLAGTITYLLVALLVLYPLATLVLNSFGISIINYNPTLQAYTNVFTDVNTWIAFKNTIHIGVLATFFALLYGTTLAWIVTRTNFRFKKFIKFNVFLTLCIPSYVYAVAWIDIFRRNGRLDRTLSALFENFEYVFNTYSLAAVIFVLSVNTYPIVFMAVSHALNNTNRSLEDASMLSGATRLKTTFKITLPLIAPTIFSIGLFVFSRVIANFGVPAALAFPSGIEVLTTRVLSSLNNLQLQLATTLSVLLLVLSVTVFYWHKFVMKNKRYTTISSSTSKPQLIELKKSKAYVTIFVVIFQFLTSILPFITLSLTSLARRSHLPLSFQNLTFSNFIGLFQNPIALRGIKNSITFGILGASIAIIIALGIIFISYKTKMFGHKFIETVSSLPMACPSVVLGIAAILAWSSSVLNIYGTPWIIIITYISLFIPIVLKNLVGIIESQEPSLDSAARVSGASRLRTFKDITLPSLKSGIFSAGLMAFIIALREIPISLLLFSYGNETIGVLMFNVRSDFGGTEFVSAISVLVITSTVLLRMILKRVSAKQRNKKDTSLGGFYASSN